MNNKKITIEQLEIEGFIAINEDGKRAAISENGLSKWIENYFYTSVSVPKIVPVKTSEIIKQTDLRLYPFEYDKDKMKEYKALQYQELSNGKTVLKYGNTTYFTSKIAVMETPFPFPKGFFKKEDGWSDHTERAFKLYREYLARTIEKQKESEPDNPDRAYKPFGLNKDTRPGKEDIDKIEGEI